MAAIPIIDGVGTIGALRAMQMDEDSIAQITKMLETYAGELQQQQPTNISRADFGASWWGGEFGRHTEKAQANVAKAIVDMVEGLRGFKTGIKEHQQHVVDVDEVEAAGRLKPIQTMIENSAACVAGGDLTSETVGTNACAPGEESR
ncbi:hypothetical protein [Nocardioides campestrisoli]|uniref:hypothetical protein n=1 Tax=Nocardioides campestrisoli TaxID=2736757 RepID=UPI0015E737BD|nr:hypothetical protein [Nocardioides campestrisoli]